ncbi:hypothetical protein FCM35_KLT02952 [Carex littledalei]|uniref:RNase H type-1 domain-containing protein n=1 Tax=Carex littledalei TaxID=544730 RepID=A0A833R1K9_9POAL|nr:hypothetical protein FCM35_KLT02952 [Carex littledalei]
MANVIWAIWRCRNGKLYAGKTPTRDDFLKFYNSNSVESMIAATANKMVPTETQGLQPIVAEYRCHCDGSWTNDWKGGVGIIITMENKLVMYNLEGVTAGCAMQAEAQALRKGTQLVNSLGIRSCVFYTDSASLATLVSQSQPPIEADWRISERCMKSGKH